MLRYLFLLLLFFIYQTNLCYLDIFKLLKNYIRLFDSLCCFNIIACNYLDEKKILKLQINLENDNLKQ